MGMMKLVMGDGPSWGTCLAITTLVLPGSRSPATLSRSRGDSQQTQALQRTAFPLLIELVTGVSAAAPISVPATLRIQEYPSNGNSEAMARDSFPPAGATSFAVNHAVKTPVKTQRTVSKDRDHFRPVLWHDGIRCVSALLVWFGFCHADSQMRQSEAELPLAQCVITGKQIF